MDSLTQMVLGAAIGELALGRKIGNKAMFWGAVAGTIPDLDVLANPFISEAQSVKFHRGPTHSFFFCAVASALFAFLLRKYFSSDLFFNKTWRWIWKIIFSGIPAGLALLVLYTGIGSWSPWPLAGTVLLLSFVSAMAWIRTATIPGKIELPTLTEWFWFFFWIFATHIILDVFTTYGTQILWPFTDHPFAWDTISVVDPLYTLPFLGFIFTASFFRRGTAKRSTITRAGIIVSSLYLALTVVNKFHVTQVFNNTMEEESAEVIQFKTTPTLFNNLLWYGIAETETHFIKGYYSLFDDKRQFTYLEYIPKNHHLLEDVKPNSEVEILQWFSGGYHSIEQHNGALEWYDLRFGNIDFTGEDAGASSPFYFLLKKDEDDNWKVLRDRPDFDRDPAKIFWSFYQRIIGNRPEGG